MDYKCLVSFQTSTCRAVFVKLNYSLHFKHNYTMVCFSNIPKCKGLFFITVVTNVTVSRIIKAL